MAHVLKRYVVETWEGIGWKIQRETDDRDSAVSLTNAIDRHRDVRMTDRVTNTGGTFFFGYFGFGGIPRDAEYWEGRAARYADEALDRLDAAFPVR